MTTSLNLYATKVFSEQPVALWALDDTVDYVALVDPSNQDLSTWTATGVASEDGIVDVFAEGVEFEQTSTPPFDNIVVNGITEQTGGSGEITFTSPVALQESDFNQDLGSFAIGAYFFIYDTDINVRLGYEYTDPETLDSVIVIRENVVNRLRDIRSWAFVSETFALPESFSDLRFVIEAYPASPSYSSPYKLAIHGINIGQWAEEYHVESLGVSPQDLPSDINISSQAIPALAYGLEGRNGYYLSSNNVLHAKNSGLPLVYGAFNSTVDFPNGNLPSLILPGFGFMNDSGKYKKMTLEFWAKVNSNSLTPQRFFGPISSEDGLYVDGPFLKLRVGNNFASHYVGEWGRPMLLDIRLTPNSAELLVNGEIVIDLELDPETVSYPDKNDSLDNDQDWLGFYAYDSVPTVQIDCVGIYPYEVPAIVAKRRFVYGQGVEFPSNIKGLDPSTPVSIDYSVANYSKNYSYPKIGRWRNGVIDNIVPNAAELSLPEYTLPTLKFSNKSADEWYASSQTAHAEVEEPFISMKPEPSWSATEGYLLFPSLNMLIDDTKAFYGIFELDSLPEEREVIFQLVNELNNEKLTIYAQGANVHYTLSYKGITGNIVEDNFYTSTGHITGSSFFVGMHLLRAGSHYGKKLSTFFGAKQNIKVFVGGTKEFSNTFNGKIKRLGFSTARNLKKVESQFASRGIPTDFENVFDLYEEGVSHDGGVYFLNNDVDQNGDAIEPPPHYWSSVFDGGDPYDFPVTRADTQLASYTLLPKMDFDTYKLDIGVDSYWEDYLPLTYFGTYVDNAKGNKYFDLDFIQLNIDYPKFYNITNGNYDTTGSIIKTYVSFQYLAEGSNKVSSSFTNTQSLPQSGVVRPGSEWLNTRYEVLNDTIIYPPTSADFNSLSINIHIEMAVEGIIENPAKVRSLSLASQAFGFSPKRIGNKFGAEMFPYRKVGGYYDYKSVEAFSIYKGNAPYLYASSNNGMKTLASLSTDQSVGIAMPINKNKKNFFKVSAFQIAVKYDGESFPTTPSQIFEIEHLDDVIKFYMVSDSPSGNRAQVYGISQSTGRLAEGVLYSLDGKVVKRPALSLNSWSMLGISFSTPISFENFVGAVRVTGPIMFNNVSYYQITPEDEAETFAFRKWYAVRSEPNNPLGWDYWANQPIPNPENPEEDILPRWSDVLFLTEALETVLDTTKIYKQYTGTDRVVFDFGSTLRLGNYRYSALKDVRWSRQIVDSA